MDLFVDPLLRGEQTCSIRAACFKNWQARGPGLGNLFVFSNLTNQGSGSPDRGVSV